MKWGVMMIVEEILVMIMMLARSLSSVDSLFLYIFGSVSRMKMFAFAQFEVGMDVAV